MGVPNDASRRAFFRAIAAVAVTPAFGGTARQRTGISYDYVMKPSSIDVFRTEHGQRVKMQSVPSRCPAFAAVDAHRRRLFAVNEINEYEGLPTGSVESYAIQPADGSLRLIGRQRLSLSATAPRHLAIAPNGEHVIVAVYGGGAYNVLPVLPDGTLGPVVQAIKEIGQGADPERQDTAHPHSVLFHPSGKFVIGTDLGSDRINVFSFEGGHMKRVHQIEAAAGSGPAGLRFQAAESILLVQYELKPSLSWYRFDSGTGRLTDLANRSGTGSAKN